jgi:hypothetical protein
MLTEGFQLLKKLFLETIAWIDFLIGFGLMTPEGEKEFLWASTCKITIPTFF